MPTRAAICLAAICLLTAAGATGQEILTQTPAAEADSTVPPPVTGLAPAPAPAQPIPGQAWPQVQVVTDEGWHLPDCSLRWLDDGSRVRVTRADGSWRDYLPWTVTSVFAADGTDLTAIIAAARPGGVRPTPPLPGTPGSYDEVGTAALVPASGLGVGPEPLSPFRFAITAGGGYAMFAGDWYGGFDAAASLHALARFSLGGNSWMTLGYRRQGGGSESGSIYDYSIEDYRSVTVDVRVDEYLVMVGNRINPSTATRNIGYAEFGVVWLNHKATAEIDGYGSGGVSESKLGLVLQMGGLIALDENFGLDLGVDLAFKPGMFDEYETSGFIAGAHVGLGYIAW